MRGSPARSSSRRRIRSTHPFERQSREATFNRSFGEAVQLAAKGALDEANTRLAEARATRIDEGKVTALASDIQRRMDASKPATSPPTTTIADAVPPANTPAPAPAATYPPPAPATPPVNTVATKKPAASPRAPLVVPAPKAAPDYGQPTSAPTDLRDGLLAFFSNDYRRAVPLLENAARQSGASPRARAFLSCARVALVPDRRCWSANAAASARGIPGRRSRECHDSWRPPLCLTPRARTARTPLSRYCAMAGLDEPGRSSRMAAGSNPGIGNVKVPAPVLVTSIVVVSGAVTFPFSSVRS